MSESACGAQIAEGHVADLVDGINPLAAYYGFVEAAAYVASLKSANAKRDFHGELIRRAQALLEFANNDLAVDSIDGETRSINAKLAPGSALGAHVSAFARAKQLEPNGCALLNVHEPLDIPTLKAAYRSAAKRYHPDVGGDTTIMQRINQIYGLFFAALQQDIVSATTTPEAGATAWASAVQIMDEARQTVFVTAIDDLSADTAFGLLPSLQLDTGFSSGRVFEGILRLAALLSAIGRTEDAQVALARGEAEFARFTARGLNYAAAFARAAKAVAQPKTVRLVINHQRQADNALRLGVIDRARYDQTIQRLERAAAAATAQQANLVAALAAIDFPRLPIDPTDPCVPTTGLVPDPPYYSRLENLEPQQVQEYQQAYFAHNGRLAGKYIFVRLTALLKSVIMGYDLGTALHEAKTIQAAAPRDSSLIAYTSELCDLFDFFSQETPRELEERFRILLRIDRTAIGTSIPVASTTMTVRISVPKPISLSPAYLQFAREPLEQLRSI